MVRLGCLALALVLAQGASATPSGAPTPPSRPWVIALQVGQESLIPLVQAIYAELGIAVEFQTLPSERALAEANLGRADGEMGRIPGALADYPNLLQTRENLITIELEAWKRKESPSEVKSVDDLARLRVGIVIGSKISELFVADHGWAVTAVSSHEALARLLAAGRLDVALISTASRDSEVRKTGVLALRGLAKSCTYHVLNRQHAALALRFDAVLQRMKRDGRYESLLQLP